MFKSILPDKISDDVINEIWENNIMGGGSSVDQRNIDGVIRALPDLSQKKSGVLKAGRMNN